MTVSYADTLPDPAVPTPRRDAMRAIRRGFLGRCPHCGTGRLFRGYVKVVDACEDCGEDLHHQRADDFPPYLTIFIVGHIVVPAMYLVERSWRPELWVHAALWLPLTLILSLALLRPLKGATVGLQWAFYMHGFDPNDRSDEPIPEPVPAPATTGSLP